MAAAGGSGFVDLTGSDEEEAAADDELAAVRPETRVRKWQLAGAAEHQRRRDGRH